MRVHQRHLTPRDMEILNFVYRYRIGTVEMLAEQVFSDKDNWENICRVLRRLERRGLLRRESWDRGFSYYILTPRGCRVLGISPQTPRPLTEQSLPVVLAIAYFPVVIFRMSLGAG